jgi:hypothetical protein
MSGNKINEDNAGEGLDWRSDADAALAHREPEKAAFRQRGRPKGSTNKKTADFSAWYEAQGFKDPLALQADFMSADPVALQAWFIEHEQAKRPAGKFLIQAVPTLLDIVKEQMARADAIAPYLHGKAPARDVPDDERLPVLVINMGTNQLDQAAAIARQRGLSIGRPLDLTPNEINKLADRSTGSPTAESPTKGKDE